MKVKAHESNRYVKLEFIQQEQQSRNTKLVGAGYIDPFTPFHMISSSGFILKKITQENTHVLFHHKQNTQASYLKIYMFITNKHSFFFLFTQSFHFGGLYSVAKKHYLLLMHIFFLNEWLQRK